MKKSHKSEDAITSFTPTGKQCRLFPESAALVPRQQLKLNDDLLLQGSWGKEDAVGQGASFNTLDN